MRLRVSYNLVFFGMLVAIFSVMDVRAITVPLQLLNQYLTFDTVVSFLDGRLDIAKGARSTLEKQIRELRGVSYEPIKYSQDDYAITVGALVGEGNGIADEVSRIIKIGESRRKELTELNSVDGKLADTEAAYALADRVTDEYMRVFEEILDEGFGGLDQLIGAPIFNNWMMLHDDIQPLVKKRLSEIRRVRKELDMRRTQLHQHNMKASGWLKELEEHLQQLSRMEEAERLQRADDTQGVMLDEIKEIMGEVISLQNSLVETNRQVRKEITEIHERQKRKYKRARVSQRVLSMIQAGVAAAAISTGAGSTSTSATPSGDISVTINSQTIIIEMPAQQVQPPVTPNLIRP